MNAVTILLQATVIMLVLVALRPLLKRFLSARARCALWAIPALRLLLPFEVHSTFSVMAPAQPITAGFENAVSRPIDAPTWLGSGIGLENVQNAAAGAAADTTTALSAVSISVGGVLFLIWLVGALVTGGIIIYQNVRFYSAVKRLSVPFDGGWELPVHLMEVLPSPCLAGILRPRIYINEHALVSDEVLEMTIRHELTHYKRHDHIWSAVRGLLLALYWFHPLVWLCSELFRCDCETACDEAATRGMDTSERENYGMALIILASRGGRGNTGRLVCLSTMSSKKLLKERITQLAKGRTFRCAAVIALLLAGVLCLTMCTVPERTDDDTAGLDSGTRPLSTQTEPDATEDIPQATPATPLVPRQGEAGTLTDLAYYLELSVPGETFVPMDSADMDGILAEYGDLLEGYTLMGRSTADGRTTYIVGEFSGPVELSPLYMMYSVEVSGGDQLLYQEADSAAVEQALLAAQIPDVGTLIRGSRIYYSTSDGLILIQPKDVEVELDVARNRYLYTPNGRAYIADAVSRGIAMNSTDKPYLYVYLISETFGEIAERIPLTEAEAAAILAEERQEITEGFGFSATLHLEDETIYFTERTGVPRSVIDMAVEKCGYKFADPSYIRGPVLGATLECSWLTEPLYADEADLTRLGEILKNAEFGYVGACGYGAKLTLELTGGETLTVFKGTDDCDSIVFGSYGGYFLGDEANREFWEIFGLDPDTKELLDQGPQ